VVSSEDSSDEEEDDFEDDDDSDDMEVDQVDSAAKNGKLPSKVENKKKKVKLAR
jgi:hypothetical protein